MKINLEMEWSKKNQDFFLWPTTHNSLMTDEVRVR
jgi:hypothetical protein